MRVYAINNRFLFKENSGHNLFFLSYSFTDSFIQQMCFEHLLLYLTGTVLGTWNTSVNKTKNAAFMLHYILISELFFFSKLFTNNRQKEIANDKNSKLELFTLSYTCPLHQVQFQHFPHSSTFRSSKQQSLYETFETLAVYLVLKCDC